ncbi:MAG: hypothetical protein MUF20_08770, partial [Methylotetracoccus sp.]|nr:hypothetical protein [Methylotetracoccus sp.]
MKRFSLFGGRKRRQAEADTHAPVEAGTEGTARHAGEAGSGAVGTAGGIPLTVGGAGVAVGTQVPWTPPSAEELPASPARGLMPGSDGEHRLQCEFGSEERAHGFYARQVLDYLSPAMHDFIARQEILIVATADRHGECDCTSKFGRPGFIRVLNEKYVMYP